MRLMKTINLLAGQGKIQVGRKLCSSAQLYKGQRDLQQSFLFQRWWIPKTPRFPWCLCRMDLALMANASPNRQYWKVMPQTAQWGVGRAQPPSTTYIPLLLLCMREWRHPSFSLRFLNISIYVNGDSLCRHHLSKHLHVFTSCIYLCYLTQINQIEIFKWI